MDLVEFVMLTALGCLFAIIIEATIIRRLLPMGITLCALVLGDLLGLPNFSEEGSNWPLALFFSGIVVLSLGSELLRSFVLNLDLEFRKKKN